MQDKIFKVKIFEIIHKSVKSVKVFSLEIFRLYGILPSPPANVQIPSVLPGEMICLLFNLKIYVLLGSVMQKVYKCTSIFSSPGPNVLKYLDPLDNLHISILLKYLYPGTKFLIYLDPGTKFLIYLDPFEIFYPCLNLHSTHCKGGNLFHLKYLILQL